MLAALALRLRAAGENDTDLQRELLRTWRNTLNDPDAFVVDTEHELAISDALLYMLSLSLYARRAPEHVRPGDVAKSLGASFPRVNIPAFWSYPGAAILRMTQSQAFATLHALEWALMSDLNSGSRLEDPEWFTQFREAYQLVSHRIMFLCANTLDAGLLDMNQDDGAYVHEIDPFAELVRQHERALAAANPATPNEEADEDDVYDSDAERRGRAKSNTTAVFDAGIDPEVRALMVKQARVTHRFVLECNSLLVSIERGVRRLAEVRDHIRPQPVPEEAVDVRKIRGHLFRECSLLQESNVVAYQKQFIYKMQVTPMQERIYRNTRPYDTKPSARTVIVCVKHTLAATLSACESVADMVTPNPASPHEDRVRRRVATDALFHYYSSQFFGEDVVDAVTRAPRAPTSRAAYNPNATRGRMRMQHKTARAVQANEDADSLFGDDQEAGPQEHTYFAWKERAANVWILRIDDAEHVCAPSFTHIFAYLRRIMRMRGHPSVYREVDLAKFDAMLFA